MKDDDKFVSILLDKVIEFVVEKQSLNFNQELRMNYDYDSEGESDENQEKEFDGLSKIQNNVFYSLINREIPENFNNENKEKLIRTIALIEKITNDEGEDESDDESFQLLSTNIPVTGVKRGDEKKRPRLEFDIAVLRGLLKRDYDENRDRVETALKNMLNEVELFQPVQRSKLLGLANELKSKDLETLIGQKSSLMGQKSSGGGFPLVLPGIIFLIASSLIGSFGLV